MEITECLKLRASTLQLRAPVAVQTRRLTAEKQSTQIVQASSSNCRKHRRQSSHLFYEDEGYAATAHGSMKECQAA